MASPTVAARTETQLASGTTLTIAFTQTTGDTVIIFLGLNDTAQALATVGDSFTNLTNTNATFHILYKVLTGSEGGNVAVTVGSATKGAALAYNIQGAATGTIPVFSTVATGTDTAPNPGTLSPAGGSADYLWLAAFRQNGEEADDDAWCNSAPATFGNLIAKTSGTGGLPATNGSIASADLASTTATVDPGVFDTDQSLAWRAYTVAVYPVPTVTVNAGLASGTGAANTIADPQESVNAGLPAGTGAALTPTALEQVPGGLGAGTGLAYDTTIITGKQVDAELATGTGAAYALSEQEQIAAGLASGTGVALDSAAQEVVSAGIAQGSGAALAPSPAELVFADLALGSGAANAPTVQEQANAQAALAIGTAYDPTILTVGGVVAAPSFPPSGARIRGLAPVYVEMVRVQAQTARGFGRAHDARLMVNDDELAIALLLGA